MRERVLELEQVRDPELVLEQTSRSQQFDRTCTEERYVEDLRGE